MMSSFDVSIFIITNDNTYIDYGEYVKRNDGKGEMVCLTNDVLNEEYKDDNSILIHKNWQYPVDKSAKKLDRHDVGIDRNGYTVAKWSNLMTGIPCNDDFRVLDYSIANKYEKMDLFRQNGINGWKSCENIMANVKSGNGERVEGIIPAIMIARHAHVFFNGSNLHGYLPAIGQWIYINENIKKVNAALGKICTFHLPVLRRGCIDGIWWSSTESFNGHAWYINDDSPSHATTVTYKARVFPLFR